MIEVYHVNVGAVDREALWLLHAEPAGTAKKLFLDKKYKLVALVDADNFETAWCLTNNIESSWSHEPDSRVKVQVQSDHGLRSSMVGDIFVRDGNVHVVAMIGFEEIGLLSHEDWIRIRS